MLGLPRRVHVAVNAIVLTACAVFGVSLHALPHTAQSREIFLAVGLAVLVMFARAFPVHIAPQIKIAVDTAPMYAAVLLLPPPLAMVACATGSLAGSAVRRNPWLQTEFATAEATLRVGIASAVFRAFAGGELTDLDPGPWLFAAPIAAFVMYAVNESLIDLVVLMQTRRSPFVDFWRRRRHDLAQEGALFLLGLLVAGIGSQYPWTVALLLAPSFVVYRSLRDAVALRAQTREALEELADVVDMRDHYTYRHSQRVAEMARLTAKEMGLSGDECEMIAMAARVHDVGKIGIKSTVLLAPGPLDPAGWEEMRSHPEVGARLIARFPQFARGRTIVLAHHERWDGGGYPAGLAGERIPLGARVLAVADSWDAMTSHRAYRRALPLDVAVRELECGRGTQFDPAAVTAFLRVIHAFPDVARGDLEEPQGTDGPLPASVLAALAGGARR